MKTKLKKYLHYFTGLLMIYSCVTPVDIPTGYTSIDLVITGQVSTLTDRNTVQLGVTTKSVNAQKPILNALVLLFDENGNSLQYVPEPELPGSYRLEGFSAEPGKTYYLEVVTPDGGVYRSEPETVPLTSNEFEISHDFEERELVDYEGTVGTSHYVNVFVDATFTAPEDPRYVKYNVEETYLLRPTDFPDPFNAIPDDCFITQNADPQRIVVIDRREIQSNSIKHLLVASRIADQSFHTRHYLTVYQSTVTAASYEYWRKLNVLANQTGSIFDVPPAIVTGNVYNTNYPEIRVNGFFQAVNQKFKRFFILRGDLPNFLPPYCEYDPNRYYYDYPSECIDCLRPRNSTLKRPDWF
jgi:hypothetical protein